MFTCTMLLNCVVAVGYVLGHSLALPEGKWRATGLLTEPSGSLDTQVCLDIKGGSATEYWFMRSRLTAAEQKSLDTDAIEVKYKINAKLTALNSSTGPGSIGYFVFSAVKVWDINTDPPKFSTSMATERQKAVGRSRRCKYELLESATNQLRMQCSSTKPKNGFFRYGTESTFPPVGWSNPVLFTRGSCNQLPGVEWPNEDGYRVHISFAGSVGQCTAITKQALADQTSKILDLPQLVLLRVTAGSFIVDLFGATQRDPVVEQRLASVRDEYSRSAGKTIAGLPVISMSFAYHAVSKPTESNKLLPVPIWALVMMYLVATGIYSVAGYFAIK